ncbi:uncharacterized protein N7511_008251 [Penicillium nucicola]|uniref:uncharacterized protein n=1 Tax=Penicillium nucicola TaxID=1850975 RepID=UPI00254586DC|nr:uncharacterized protein N7511_008251 [Penicillium nucicola]KAJ5754098.1 hypothetical protein N7511_008251 [Penicillium nucicola]
MAQHSSKENPRENLRQSSDVSEHRNLLGAYDQLEDKSEEEWVGDERLPRRTRKVIPRPATAKGWVLLGFLVTTVMGLGAVLGFSLKRASTLECVRMSSSYSPLLESVEYYDLEFQAELGVQNEYKGHPRPELDAMWNRIGKIHPISMPQKYLGVLNKTGSGISYSEEQGGGIMVEIEVFHQLHCLNFLRKVIYADYYTRPENMPAEFMVGDDLFYNHIDHCIDFLRQVLMCAGDVTPVTSNWVLTHHSPHPDFNTMHKCRNFDRLLEFVEENDNGGVPKQTPNPSWRPPPGLDKTIFDYEPNYPSIYHGPAVNDSDRWTHNH